MSMQQLTNEELQTLREDLVRKLGQADREITRRQHELFGGAPEDILRSTGCDKTVRQYGRSIPADELIRACTIERESPRAAGHEDKGKD